MNAAVSKAFPVSTFPCRKDAQCSTAPDFTRGDTQRCSGIVMPGSSDRKPNALSFTDSHRCRLYVMISRSARSRHFFDSAIHRSRLVPSTVALRRYSDSIFRYSPRFSWASPRFPRCQRAHVLNVDPQCGSLALSLRCCTVNVYKFNQWRLADRAAAFSCRAPRCRLVPLP
jgi:hypothetical protein